MNKNLNDIIPPSRRRALEGSETPTFDTTPVATRRDPRTSYERPSSPRSGRAFPFGTAIAALVVVGLSVGALFAFSGAKVNIVPATSKATVAGEFISTLSSGDLPFEVITVEKVASVSVESEGTETVTQAAQGTITIMNKQETPQQLIKNTRFQTPDGFVFRIRDSVTVPASKNGTPGVLKAAAYADAAGEQYNVGPTTFTVPGLQGGKSFELVTGMSDEAMKGGFSGARPSVGQTTRDTKTQDMRASLATDIEKALTAKIPEGYVLLTGARMVAYTSEPDTAATGNNVSLSEKATATGIVFPEAALARSIAYQVVGSYSGQPVELAGEEGLTLAPAGDLPNAGTAEFAFSLNGNATIVWSVDAAKIAGAVSGKNRDAAQGILAGFPEIETAQLILRPFWATTFPQDPTKITVSVDANPVKK